METTFSLTTSDFRRLQRIVGSRFRRRFGVMSLQFALRVFVWTCIGLAGFSYLRIMETYPDASSALGRLGLLLIAALLAIIVVPYVAQSAALNHLLAPNGAFLASQTVSLSSSALRVRSATADTEVLWSGFLSRADDDLNHYLFIDHAQALVLPRAAIASFAGEFERHTAHLKNEA